MSQLYTVFLRQKKDMSVYDKRGKVIETKVVYVETSISALPAQTVQAYKKLGDAFVRAEPYHLEGASKVRASSTGQGFTKATRKTPEAGSRPAAAPKSVEHKPALEVGSYAEAINKAVRDQRAAA